MQSAQRPRPPPGEPRLLPPGTGRRAQARGSLQDSVFCGAGEVGVGSVLMEGVWVPTAGAARRQSESRAVSLVPSAPKAPLARGYIGSRGESTSGKKKVTKSYKRPGCAMSTWAWLSQGMSLNRTVGPLPRTLGSLYRDAGRQGPAGRSLTVAARSPGDQDSGGWKLDPQEAWHRPQATGRRSPV